MKKILIVIFSLLVVCSTAWAGATSSFVSNYKSTLSEEPRMYGVSWNENTDEYIRTGSLQGQPVSQTLSDDLLPIQAKMKRCVLDTYSVDYYLCPTDSTLKADCSTAANLDGTDGQVMVEIPAFYYQYSYNNGIHTWNISEQELPGFTLHQAFYTRGNPMDVVTKLYVGAYEGAMWDDSLSQIVPPADIATSLYEDGDELWSVSGTDIYPKVTERRSEFRTMASENGISYQQLGFYTLSAIQLLYLIEYADFNSQDMIGYGRTMLTGGTWTAGSYIGKCGKSNSDGNGTNAVSTDSDDAYMTYRGIENIFGGVYDHVDGFTIDQNVPYVSANYWRWDDDTEKYYKQLNIVLPRDDGYMGALAPVSDGFLPAAVNGSTGQHSCDYYWENSTVWAGMVVGGNAESNVEGGLFAYNMMFTTNVAAAYAGGRLVWKDKN